MDHTSSAIAIKIHKMINSLYPELQIGELNGNSNIVEDLGLDSVQVLEVFANLAETFDLQLDENLADNLINVRTLNDLVNIINSRLKN